MSANVVLGCRALRKEFRQGPVTLTVLKDLDFEVREGVTAQAADETEVSPSPAGPPGGAGSGPGLAFMLASRRTWTTGL